MLKSLHMAVVIIMAAVSPAFAQAPNETATVRQVAAQYPYLLTTNTYDSDVEFTQRVLAALGPNWGHIAKNPGEGQGVPKGWNNPAYSGVSHDVICYLPNGQQVDILGNASANSDPNPSIHGPATVIWAEVERHWYRPGNPCIAAFPVPGSVAVPAPAAPVFTPPLPVNAALPAPGGAVFDASQLVAALQSISVQLNAIALQQQYANDRLEAIQDAADRQVAIAENLIAKGSWLETFSRQLAELKTTIERKKLW